MSGDQAIGQPLDVVLDRREQPRAAVLAPRKRQRFGPRSSQADVSGFFNSSGDIGGEHLDRLDPVIERIRHVAQRAGQMSDLVAAAG